VPELDDPSHIPTLEEAERILIQRALAATRGHKGKACELLGISRPTLERKLQRYGVVAPPPAGAKVLS
jgi:two-component system response regulator AtoC